MTCSSWPGMFRTVERCSLRTPSSPVKDVGVSASGPRTARDMSYTAHDVCCVELGVLTIKRLAY